MQQTLLETLPPQAIASMVGQQHALRGGCAMRRCILGACDKAQHNPMMFPGGVQVVQEAGCHHSSQSLQRIQNSHQELQLEGVLFDK